MCTIRQAEDLYVSDDKRTQMSEVKMCQPDYTLLLRSALEIPKSRLCVNEIVAEHTT